MMHSTARLVLLVILVVACDSPTGIDFDPDVYDPMPRIEDLDWSAVDAAEDWAYWEVRWAFEPQPHQVIGSGGRLSRAELDQDVRAALDAVAPNQGFSDGCLPAYCYRYVVAVAEDGAITTILDATALRAFLAPITSPEEAILLVGARDFLWWDNDADTGIRAIDGGWDVVVHQMVRMCDPVQTDRVRFRVFTDGRVTERAREVWERHEGACV